MGYREDAKSDAADTVSHYEDEIVEMILDDGKASTDLFNDYGHGDSYHHESHVDKWYSLTDAAEVLDELDEYEEDDSGLWDGQAPKEAISTMAAFTYGRAVLCLFQELIEEINDAAEEALSELDEKHADEDIAKEEAATEKREELIARMDEAEDEETQDAIREELEALTADDEAEEEREERRKNEKQEAVTKVVRDAVASYSK